MGQEKLVQLRFVLLAEGIDYDVLAKKPITLRLEGENGVLERRVIFTAEGFIEDACVERKVVSEEPGIPPVIKTVELAYFFQGRQVRQDAEVQVDPAQIGADGGKVG